MPPPWALPPFPPAAAVPPVAWFWSRSVSDRVAVTPKVARMPAALTIAAGSAVGARRTARRGRLPARRLVEVQVAVADVDRTEPRRMAPPWPSPPVPPLPLRPPTPPTPPRAWLYCIVTPSRLESGVEVPKVTV